MNRRLLASGCSVSLFLAPIIVGCIGDSIAVRTVSLRLPTATSQNKTNLSTSDPQVKQALQIIDAALAAQGFPRDTHPIAAEDQARGIVAFYGICGVSLSDGKVEIGFVERYRRDSSKTVKQLSNTLKRELGRRFGQETVQVIP